MQAMNMSYEEGYKDNYFSSLTLPQTFSFLIVNKSAYIF